MGRYNRVRPGLALLAACFAASGTGAAERPALPADAVVLFGANWCAPCLDELRTLPALAQAAAPMRIVLAWTDGAPVRLWREWPANAEQLPVADAVRTIERLGGQTAGLPYAVLVDGQGRRCADRRGGVTPERIAALKARC